MQSTAISKLSATQAKNRLALVQKAKAKAKQAATERAGMALGLGACAAVGLAERNNVQLPTVAGIQPVALYGTGLAVAGAVMKGKVGTAALEAGAALLGVAVYKLTSGEPLRR